MGASAVEVRGLVKRYGTLTAVDDLDLVAPTGAVTAVLGPNGAGKTTTLEICEGFRGADAGSVAVLGLDPVRDAAQLRDRVGVMLQAGGVYGSVSPAVAVRHAAALYADPLPPGPLMERLGLARVSRTAFKRLSGGEQQRTLLALALVGRPELVFLDEPTAGLDPQSRHAVWGLVRDLRAAGVAVVLTTHYLEEAEALADHVVIVDHGHVVAEGSPSGLTAAEGRALRFTAPAGLDTTTLRDSLAPGHAVREEGPGRYRVDGPVDPDLLAAVTAWCAARGVMPEHLDTGRRTLEDVFLELTGRELRP